jgi:hypothetical protein
MFIFANFTLALLKNTKFGEQIKNENRLIDNNTNNNIIIKIYIIT